ncbi:MAG TPA: hypothetical protein PK916_08830 [Bacteroidota bacterium]|nr:hypothetical protein [Bacteroidota bacterium]
MGLARVSVGVAQALDKLRRRRRLLTRGNAGKVADDDMDLVAHALDGLNNDVEFAFRNFQWDRAKPAVVSGGGGSVEGMPIRHSPVAFVVAEFERVGKGSDGQFRPMDAVRWSLWNRHNARYYVGVGQDCDVRNITGTVHVESLNGGVPSAYHVLCMPVPGSGSTLILSGDLIGLDIGFGRYGDDRLRFRVDLYRFAEDLASATLQEVKDGSVKFRSTRATITDGLLSDYQTHGLRLKCHLTINA